MPKQGQLKGTPVRRAEFIEKLRGLGEGSFCVTWPWTDLHESYTRIYVDGVKVNAHRWVYEQINGALPKQDGPGAIGPVVMHSCDHPWCVRPSHLLLGSQGENIQDSVRKNRWPRKVLSDEQVADIRRLANQGVRQRRIAEAYAVTEAHISAIVLNKARLPRE